MSEVSEDMVEIPKPARGSGAVYPFAKMEIGEHFDEEIAKAGSVSSAASQYGKRHGKAFTTRQIAAEAIIRVWRTA